jgi:ABC-type uncharacterized transport system permease subunit
LLRPPVLARSGALEKLANDPRARLRITIATAIIGAVMTVHAAIAITLAILPSTEAFLLASKAVNWTLAGAALAAVWCARCRSRRAQADR